MSGRRIVVPARRGALPPDPGPAARFTRAFTRTFAVRNNVALFHVPDPASGRSQPTPSGSPTTAPSSAASATTSRKSPADFRVSSRAEAPRRSGCLCCAQVLEGQQLAGRGRWRWPGARSDRARGVGVVRR